jgi:hypothetical protein
MEHDGHGEERAGREPPAEEHRGGPDEQRIRERAHQIWIDEGRPEGRATDHWLRARWELERAPQPKHELARLEGELRPEE